MPKKPGADIELLTAHLAAAFGKPPHGGVERSLVAVHQGHARAVVGHDLCVYEPDATRGAGHDRGQPAHVEQFCCFHYLILPLARRPTQNGNPAAGA
jgi:hypothetical protein